MDPVDEPLRIAVYRGFAATGRAPSHAELAASTGIPESQIPERLAALADAHHLVIRDGEIVLAHPFASTNFGFSVMGERTLWWGGCAWDAFAIPNLVDAEPSALVATECPGCGRPHAWRVDRSGPPEGDQVVQFPTDAAHVWDDVVHTCSMQRIFCDRRCIDAWSERTGVPVGSVFDLGTLWRLASRWYEGRLDSPYERRDPATAIRFFEEVGMPRSFYASLESLMTLRLFSFGTLQLEQVQQSLLGTSLDGEPDALVGYRVSEVRITDPAVIEASGSDVHPGIVATGEPSDRVDGIVFEVTPEQLAVIDRYEEVAYRRIEVRLESGRTAFCYEPRS